MTLTEILKQAGKTEQDITKIYHGKDNWCRCGCGGNYFSPGSRGFKMAVNKMNKVDNDVRTNDVDIATNSGYNFINIPHNDKCRNTCYCVYFD